MSLAHEEKPIPERPALDAREGASPPVLQSGGEALDRLVVVHIRLSHHRDVGCSLGSKKAGREAQPIVKAE